MKMLTILASLSLIYYLAHKNTYRPELNHINIELNKQSRQKEPIHILHLSDFHMEKISITPEDLFNSLEGKEIDLIALTGDYLERVKNIDKFIDYIKVLSSFKPKYGIYAVFGNHDYLLKRKINLFSRILEQNGVVVLRNDNKSIKINDQALNIIGIDDYKTKRSNILKAYSGLEKGINLVLTHDPNIVLEMKDYHFDYLLSGHFHGGQVYWPKPFHLAKMGKLARENIIKGLHYYNERPFYISEGLGQTALNIRLNSRPEITLHKLI